MSCVIVATEIFAPLQRVFDLARSIDLHVHSTGKTQERAIAGVTSGLIGMDETVTWQAKHFGIRQCLTSKITAFSPPEHFQDMMQKGAFASLRHDHYFEDLGDRVLMRDVLQFHSPLGFVGKIVDYFVLAPYMRRFLESRNRILKQVAESGEWRRFIS